ncbi:hypothetical protein FIBSPDRAFT_335184 [Athelia psychrophila]|uniref:Uncharacterized protein n=1 Tax=Athelia psychrophila TaxID=1759441 RepID=A0A166Q711_9AGAM|nr:hypothetical protein FIBSPDRAFT_335184 [Fibularhizoctonia sp. CBS 109695]
MYPSEGPILMRTQVAGFWVGGPILRGRRFVYYHVRYSTGREGPVPRYVRCQCGWFESGTGTTNHSTTHFTVGTTNSAHCSLGDATRIFVQFSPLHHVDVRYKVRMQVVQKHRSDANADVVSEKFRCTEGAQKGDFRTGPLEGYLPRSCRTRTALLRAPHFSA